MQVSRARLMTTPLVIYKNKKVYTLKMKKK